MWLLVIRVGGMPREELAISRIAACFVVCIQVACLGLFLHDMLPLLPEQSLASATLLLLQAISLYLNYRSITDDPGYIPAGSAAKLSAAEEEREAPGAGAASTPAVAMNGAGSGGLKALAAVASAPAAAVLGVSGMLSSGGAADEMAAPVPEDIGQSGPAADAENPDHFILGSCWTCNVPRPLRSKHCKLCDRCVLRFDHHCPVVVNCIGAGNQRQFVGFITVVLVACIVWLGIAFRFCWRTAHLAAHPLLLKGSSKRGLQHLLWRVPLAVWVAGERHPQVVLAMLVVIFCALGLSGLVSRCWACILANLTTNEVLNWRRYSYLQHEITGYCNRWDRGPLANTISFWFYPHQDWDRSWRSANSQMEQLGCTSLAPQCSCTTNIRMMVEMEEMWVRAQEEKMKRRAEQNRHRLQGGGAGGEAASSGCRSGCRSCKHR